MRQSKSYAYRQKKANTKERWRRGVIRKDCSKGVGKRSIGNGWMKDGAHLAAFTESFNGRSGFHATNLALGLGLGATDGDGGSRSPCKD